MSAHVLNSTHSYDEAQLESWKADQTDLKPGAAIGGILPLLFNKQFKAMHQKVLILLYMSNFFLLFLFFREDFVCHISLYETIVAGKKKKKKQIFAGILHWKKKIMANNGLNPVEKVV